MRNSKRSGTFKGGPKRSLKTPAKSNFSLKRCRKDRQVEDVPASPSPSTSGHSSEGHSAGASSDEEVVHREPSTYDSLLSALGSGNESLARVFKKRQKEQQGRGDSEDDIDDGSVSSIDDEEEDSEEEVEGQTKPGDILRKDDQRMVSSDDSVHDDEEASAYFGSETSDDDDISDLENDHQKNNVEQEKMSSFHVHLGHTLSQKAVEELIKNKRRFKCAMTAVGMPKSNWVGTGECIVKLNHVLRSRDLIAKNDAKLSKHPESKQDDILSGDGFLDHGFTRPKVMCLLPLRSIALCVVKRLIQLTPPSHKVNVEHIDRFSDEFGAGDATEDDNTMTDGARDDGIQRSSKPVDFDALFGGNNNDHFMIGIKITRKSIKLYNDFYSSDIIVASPLGLITKIGEAEVDKEKDMDYLSSIEVLIIDHADVIAMQNWSHVNTVFEHLNRVPSKQHGTDVMRIRQWYLDGYARFYRQTILLGSYVNPDMNALFNHLCQNYRGKVKLICEYKGVLPKVILQVRQVYERFDATSIVDADDTRMDYFAKKVFPKIKDSIEGGTMLFTSSYFEFVRLRNFLKSQNASFCLLGEYTKASDISRARVWFFEGMRKIMLYTERAHFYHRYKIRGLKNLIIYSLPERKEFYPELINMLDEAENMTCTVLFSRFDQFRLERIVGTAASKRMLSSEKGVFVFC
ncbi:hypothetical protein QJS10_CPB18g00060 [Acorus calamus]|uniref:U3 small nucleolar RNA-associated protein 25 n=1 Tax=Acorus calamus TaxID=4465 RepID=A0AAV9CP05_ACOCL|nr:hypothetical protein QJS10_CPB18g00060 [Acorus calamus]